MTQAQVNKLSPMKVRKLQLDGKISYKMLEEYCKYHNSIVTQNTYDRGIYGVVTVTTIRTRSSYVHNGHR